MREIALDTETTGLSPDTGHKIIEIGCVEMINRVRTGNSFHRYINPERDIPADATRVHGITIEQVADKPIFAHIAQDFLDFIGDSPLVIHNAPFDMAFINFELNKALGLTLDFSRVVDTLILARKKYPGASNNLDALCKRFSINREHRVKHGALIDSELLADIYLQLTGGRQGSIELTVKSQVETTVQAVTRQYREPRNFTASDEEKANHQQFISQLKNPVWETIKTDSKEVEASAA